MPWQEVSTMSLRWEFVQLARQPEVNVSEWCRRFGISRKTGYKWLARFRHKGRLGLRDRAKRPRHSPKRTAAAMEAAILGVRQQHRAWGGRKIRRRLQDLRFQGVPAASTITAVLHRHGGIDPDEARKHKATQRFEHAVPNALWQMDFKGPFGLTRGRCHPLTVLDDHSRFALGLKALANEQRASVQDALTDIFRRYGLPDEILVDNGAPWGVDRAHGLTRLTAWWLRLGIGVVHARPYHPQTLGKDERFHRTLQLEVLNRERFHDLAQAQHRFDRWRDAYNLERPHEALGLAVPAARYCPSPRAFPEALPAIDYAPGDLVRKIQAGGELFYRGQAYRVSKALHGYPVALRPTQADGVLAVYFCQHKVAHIDLRNPIE